jgi:RNA methyltransferase, TrmH family
VTQPQPVLGHRSAAVGAARRLLKSAARRTEARFLVEGAQAVGAALAVGALDELFVGESAATRFAVLVADAVAASAVAGGLRLHRVSDAAAASLSDTVTPQGLVGVARLPDHQLADLGKPRLVAVCVEANDPGNAGTVVRTSDATGADGVVFAGTGVDPYGPKAVRASAGSLFHLPVVTGVDRRTVVADLAKRGYRILAAAADGDHDLDRAIDSGELTRPTAWLFGNEAHGLPDDCVVSADAVVRVPVYGQAESLNLAVTSAVCLYASARAQRMARSGLPNAGGGERL